MKQQTDEEIKNILKILDSCIDRDDDIEEGATA